MGSEERRPGHCGVSGVGHGHGGRAGAESGGLCPEQGLSGLPHEVTSPPGQTSGTPEGSRRSGLTPPGTRGHEGAGAGRRGQRGWGWGQRGGLRAARRTLAPGAVSWPDVASRHLRGSWAPRCGAGRGRREAPGERARVQDAGAAAGALQVRAIAPPGVPAITCAGPRAPFRFPASEDFQSERGRESNLKYFYARIF